MDITILEDLGLTRAEIKIYLALLEIGTSTAGPLIRRTNLQNSVVHATLPKLIERGFVSYIKKGGVKEYSATDPENILKFIEEKKKRFENLLPELLSSQQPKIKQEAEIYQGFNGLKVMLNELIKEAKKGDKFLFFIFDTQNPEKYEKVYEFYRKDFHEQRKEKGLMEQGLSPELYREQVSKARWTKGKVKFVNFPIPTNISICNDKIAFTPWDDGEVCFLIKSKQLSDSFKAYFNVIWKLAKK